MPTPLYMTLRITLCLFLSTMNMVGHAQRYVFYDQKPYLSESEAIRVMKSLDTLANHLNLDANFDPLQLFELDNTIYATANGHSHFWKWERDSFRNIYAGYYHGYNYGAYRFPYQGEIHSYGGYGYWQFMPFLTYFDWETQGWEIRPFANDFPSVRGVAQRWTIRDDSVLYVAFTEEMPYLADREIIPIESDNFHRLDLETNTWEQLGTIKTSLIEKDMARKIETKNYFGFFNNFGNCAILQKDSLLLKAGIPLSFTPLSRMSVEEFDEYRLHIKGDSIFVYNELLYALGAVDLEEVYRSSGLSTQLIYEPTPGILFESSLWLSLPILLLIGGGFWWYRRTSKPQTSQKKDFPYPGLTEYHGQTINTETLDACLHIHPDQAESSKRNRRSQILQEIEQHYAHIIQIERVRSKVDKRIFEYHVRFEVSRLR